MSEGEGKKWRRRRDARPTELIAAAFDLFSEQGFAATRLADVARRAGVSKGTIYRYFDSKEGLFAAVIQENLGSRFAAAELLVPAFEGSSADLLKTFFTIIKAGLKGPIPPLSRLVFCESKSFPQLAELWFELVVQRVARIITGIVARGIERGEFRAVDPSLMTPLVGAPVFFLAMIGQTFPKESLWFRSEDVLDMHLELLVRGLSPTVEGEKE